MPVWQKTRTVCAPAERSEVTAEKQKVEGRSPEEDRDMYDRIQTDRW